MLWYSVSLPLGGRHVAGLFVCGTRGGGPLVVTRVLPGSCAWMLQGRPIAAGDRVWLAGGHRCSSVADFRAAARAAVARGVPLTLHMARPSVVKT